jgi:hypothetical protein
VTRSLLPGLAILCALAVGCGEDRSGTAAEPSPSEVTSGPAGAEWTEVAIVHATAAGGSVSTTPVPLDTEEALAAFVAQFERSDLGEQVRAAVEGADVPDGHVPAAAVVALGCDVPPGVAVVTDRPGDGVRVVPEKVPSPLKECFAPVTSVAVLTLDASLL